MTGELEIPTILCRSLKNILPACENRKVKNFNQNLRYKIRPLMPRNNNNNETIAPKNMPLVSSSNLKCRSSNQSVKSSDKPTGLERSSPVY